MEIREVRKYVKLNDNETSWNAILHNAWKEILALNVYIRREEGLKISYLGLYLKKLEESRANPKGVEGKK